MQQETPRQWNVESKGMVGLTVLLILLALVLFSGMAHAAIEDVLYESGKISKEEWLKIKAEREREEAEREKQIKEAVDRAITRDVKKRKWIDAVVWSGDLRLRYGQFWRYGRGTVGDNRSRLRFRLRFGPTLKIQDFTIGIRLASGDDSQVSTNQSFDNAFSKKEIRIDRAYASWNPSSFKAMTITGGKMPNPFTRNYTTDVLFDADLTPEGMAEQFKWKASQSVTLFVDLAQFVLNELSGDTNDQWMFGFQGGGVVKMGNSKVRLAVGFYDALNVTLAGLDEPTVQVFNSKVGDGSASAAYVNDYNVLNVNGSFDTNLMGFPVNIQGDWVYNTAGPVTCSGVGNTSGSCAPGNVRVDNQDQGYQVGIRLGKAKKAKTWEVAYYYKWLQADAVLSAFTDSDLGDGGTNRRGNIFWGAYNITDFLKFKVKFYNTKPLDRAICSSTSCSDDIDRLMVDWIWMF